MKYACKHDFLDLYHLSRFHNLILIAMIFRHFFFEVCFVSIIKVMSWWWNVKFGLSPLMCWLKIEWRSWRQQIEPPNWLTNVRSSEGKGDLLLTKITNRRITAVLRNSSTEEKLPFKKTVLCKNHLNCYNLFVDYLNPQQASFCKIIIEFLCYC